MTMSNETVTPEQIMEALVTVFHHKAIRSIKKNATDLPAQIRDISTFMEQLSDLMTKFANSQHVEENILDFTSCYNEYYAGCPMYTTPCNEDEFWKCVSNGIC
jgi:hypothetical protein